MFPELRERLNRFFPAESEPLSLDLKDASVTFDPVNVAWYANNGYPQIYELLSGGGPSWSGETVSRESALRHPVIWACNGIVSGSIGFLPAVLMQNVGGDKREAVNHPIFSALKYAPNEEMTSQHFRETLTSHCLLEGNGYARIIRRSGTGVAIGLEMLIPEMVTPDREKAGEKRLVYVVKEGNSPERTYTVERGGKPHEILHIKGRGWDGLRGYSVIRMGRNSFGSLLAADKNAARFWAMGGRLPYVLNQEGKFRTEEDFNRFRHDWELVYAQPHRAPILTDGIKYQQIGLSNKDSQAVEARQAQIAEGCRWFDVSPHMVGDLSRATFSNIEHLFLQFVTMTLSQWLVRWEQEFWRCVLTPIERTQGYYLKHNLNAILRGDFQTRMAGYASALQNGHMSVDEVRELEDRNKLPDGAGQDYHIQLNLQALPSQDSAQQTGLVRLGKRD